MSTIIGSVRSEFLRYRALAEGAIAQLSDRDLLAAAAPNSNSIAVICQHVSGNLRSRFTDFLTTDGEKPWRQRDEEFEPQQLTRQLLLDRWANGWQVLLEALDALSDAHLTHTVSIRQQPLTVFEALHRSLAHVSYHVGQIVFIAKAQRGDTWTYLSIPPGQSGAYNALPNRERGETLASSLETRAFKPRGYSSASPYLIVDGADKTIAFLAEVFGAEAVQRVPSPAGTVMHAEVRLDDSIIMLADGAPGWPPIQTHVHVYVEDVDATYQRALAAGATSVQAPVKKDDADKRGGVKDAGGTTWWIATKVA